MLLERATGKIGVTHLRHEILGRHGCGLEAFSGLPRANASKFCATKMWYFKKDFLTVQRTFN
jgi:hypothetical protein